MKNRLKLGIVVALGLSFGPVNSTSGSEKWRSLFNGYDLSGWVVKCKPQDASKRFWSVDSGTERSDSLDISLYRSTKGTN